jgi:sulfide dehydrogenase cytochrome subunit
MSRNTVIRIASLVAAFGLAASASAGAPAKAAGCDDCHGKNGISTQADMPSIAGMPVISHEDQLAAYKNKERPCTKVKFVSGNHPADAKDDMCSIAAKLSDEEMTELAEHYAGLAFVPFKNAVDPAKAAAGKKYHVTNCDKCHSKGGSSTKDDAGILAGQPKGYLVQAFKELRAGQRPMQDKKAPKIKALKDADVEALIEFYAGGGK